MKLFLLMLLCHIIDDFVLQPVCLSKLKQKSWWEENAPEKKYADDYITALIIHSLSWSIMISLPFLLLENITDECLVGVIVIINTFVHAVVDDSKANDKKISLTTDQIIHIFQILLTFIIFSLWAI